MKNKIVSEYEKKVWYRVAKSLYFFVFGLSLIILNFNVFFETPKDRMLQSFIIGNLIIIFTMGTIEGLFWYISCGKWGYPKDEEPINLK